MAGILTSQVNTVARHVTNLTDQMKAVQQRVELLEQVASPEKADELRQLVQIVKADVAGMDEKLVMHQKQLERYIDTVDRSAREEAKKDLQREKHLLETLLTQKLEQSLIKILKDKMEDVKLEIASVRSDMDAKVSEIHKAIQALIADMSADAEGDGEAEADADSGEDASVPAEMPAPAPAPAPEPVVVAPAPAPAAPADDIEIHVRGSGVAAARGRRASSKHPPHHGHA